MISNWTRHCKTENEVLKFERQLHNSADVLDRLRDILQGIDDDIQRAEITVKAYDSPSWPYLQAHKNGARQILKDVIKLITLDQKEHK